jgi:hypothetical protein
MKKWVKDKVNSPYIDAGYRYSDYSFEPEDNGNRINLGAYGNTKYAKSEKCTVENWFWWISILRTENADIL